METINAIPEIASRAQILFYEMAVALSERSKGKQAHRAEQVSIQDRHFILHLADNLELPRVNIERRRNFTKNSCLVPGSSRSCK
jgi:hypothetical protein